MDMNAVLHTGFGKELVRIRGTTKEGQKAIKKYGNLFWRRPLSGGGAYLIPIANGIPIVHAFIIVPTEDIIYEQSEVGYGVPTQDKGE